jgi:hypothetical protein
MPGFLSNKDKSNFSIANLSLDEEISALEKILKAETPKIMDGKTSVKESGEKRNGKAFILNLKFYPN